jgi:hypothetical protein
MCASSGLPVFQVHDLVEHCDRIAILHPNVHPRGVSASKVLYDKNGSRDLHLSFVVNEEFGIASNHRSFEPFGPSKKCSDRASYWVEVTADEQRRGKISSLLSARRGRSRKGTSRLKCKLEMKILVPF